MWLSFYAQSFMRQCLTTATKVSVLLTSNFSFDFHGFSFVYLYLVLKVCTEIWVCHHTSFSEPIVNPCFRKEIMFLNEK